jgi:hypothetical protein
VIAWLPVALGCVAVTTFAATPAEREVVVVDLAGRRRRGVRRPPVRVERVHVQLKVERPSRKLPVLELNAASASADDVKLPTSNGDTGSCCR